MFQGSYRQICVKFKDFSRTSNNSPLVFKECKFLKKRFTYQNSTFEITNTFNLVLFAAPNKGTKLYTDFGLHQQVKF